MGKALFLVAMLLAMPLLLAPAFSIAHSAKTLFPDPASEAR